MSLRAWPLPSPPLGVPFVPNVASRQWAGLIGWWPPASRSWHSLAMPNKMTPSGDAFIAAASTVGASFKFDGTGDYGTLDTQPLLGATPRTVAFWYNPSSAKSDFQSVFMLGSTGDGNAFNMSTNVTGGRDIYVYLDGGDFYSAAVLTLDAWQHIAITYNGGIRSTSNILVYLNGASVPLTMSGASTTPLTTAATYANVARFTAGFPERDFAGQIADFRLYNRDLSPAEAFALYAPQTRWQLYGVPVARKGVTAAAALRWPIVGPGIVGGGAIVGRAL